MDIHHKMQEEIAEDMVEMARSLKRNATVAKKIILDDNKVSAHGVKIVSLLPQPVCLWTSEGSISR